MSTLILDIETVGEDWESIDSDTKDTLTDWIKSSAHSDEEKRKLNELTKQKLGLSPLTGQIVSLAVYDVERSLGAVYFVCDQTEADFEDESFSYKACSEEQLLYDFWESARSYDVFVTFNGRRFDIPFLLHRSVSLSIKPTITFSNKRYLHQQSIPYHVDLYDELTLYGAFNKRPTLRMFCRAYGIKTSQLHIKSKDIQELFHQKKFRDIAKHNGGNVVATTALYQKWLTYLANPTFLNVLS